MNINEIKSIICGLGATLQQKQQARIEYGKLLAQCPHTQRGQIGKWVVENGLDFVKGRAERAACKWLASELIVCPSILLNCEAYTAIKMKVWVQAQRKRAEQPAEEAAPEAAEKQPEGYGMKLRDCRAGITNAMKRLGELYDATGIHPALTTADDLGTHPQGLAYVALMGGKETYGEAIYRQPTGAETLPEGGRLLGYAKVLRYRVVIEEADAEVWSEVPGISGLVTRLSSETIREIK